MQASIADKEKIQRLKSNIKVIWHVPFGFLCTTLVAIALYMVFLIAHEGIEQDYQLYILKIIAGVNLLLLVPVKLFQKKDDKYIEQIYEDMKQIHTGQFNLEIKTDTREKWENFDISELEDYILGCKVSLKDHRDAILDNLVTMNTLYKNLLSHINNIKIYTYIDDERVNSIHEKYIKKYSKCIECTEVVIKVVHESLDKSNVYTKTCKVNINDLIESLENKDKQTNYSYDQKEDNKTNYDKGLVTDLELRDALTLYMLTRPFTLAKLKSRYKNLLRAFHPDSNNDDESGDITKKINKAFDLLKLYTEG